MSRRKAFTIGSVVLLLLALGACRQGTVEPPRTPVDFATDPTILRGRWEGVGVSSRYQGAAFGTGGALFGAGTREGYKVWDTESGEVKLTLPNARPEAAALSPDGSLLAFRDPQTFRLLSADSGEVLASFEASAFYGDLPVFSPDDNWLLVKQGEKRQLWRIDRAEDDISLTPGPLLSETQPDISYDAAFSPDSALALVSDNTGVTLWRVADGTFVRRYSSGHEYTSVAFGPDSSIYLGADDYILRTSLEGQTLGEFRADSTYGYVPTVSLDGRYLLSNYYAFYVWDIASGELLSSPEDGTPAEYDETVAVSFSADGSTIYSASHKGEVQARALPDETTSTLGPTETRFRTETFTLGLNLTARYVDTSYYAITGTLEFEGEEALPLEGVVSVQRGLEPQTSPIEYNVDLTAGVGEEPEWTGQGRTPYQTPVIPDFFLSRGELGSATESYAFELRPRGETTP